MLILAFLGLDQTAVGIQTAYVVPWTNSTPSELFFLLGMTVLAFPGAMLIAWGVSCTHRLRSSVFGLAVL